MDQPSSMKTKLKVLAVALMTGAALGCVTGLLLSCPRPRPSALKPIDKAALQTMVDTTARELLIPGVVVLLRTPQGEFTVTYGTTLLGANSPPRADTHFRIASNTKTMTAAVIVLLAQEGKLSLDDPVSKYVPSVPNGDNITIVQLLEMRSGLYNYTNDPIISETIDSDPAKVWTPAELLAIAFAHPPNFLPGKEYEYNNTNYALLGLVAEKLDGKPLANCFQDRLFGPLGMKDTLLPASTSNTLPDPYSHGYLYGSSSVALVGEPPYSPEVQAAARAGTLPPKDYTGVNHSNAAAAGGVISTADNLATWIKALVGGRVFNANYQHRWFDSLQPEDPSKPKGQKYGYGIAQLSWGPDTIYFHGGETPGYNSKISYDPANDMTLIVWTNLPVSLDGQQTANTLWVKVLDQIYVQSPLR
jgi:D-alanyl-D-alanine carboxypeptidase